MKQAPAYLILSADTKESSQSLEAYIAKADSLMEEYGGELLVAGSVTQAISLLEGKWGKDSKLTILRFPSMNKLTQFWECDEYQKIIHLRTEILPPLFTVAVEGM